jgi:hypothetical protein
MRWVYAGKGRRKESRRRRVSGCVCAGERRTRRDAKSSGRHFFFFLLSPLAPRRPPLCGSPGPPSDLDHLRQDTRNMWPFSNSSTPPAGHAADSSADSAAPAAPTPTTPPPAAPGPSPAAVPGPATTPAVNPYALEAYQPLTAVDRSSPTAPPAFAPTVPIEAPAAGAAGGSSKPKINVQPPTSRPAVGIDPTAPAAPPPPTSAAAAATEPDSPSLTRPMNEEEFATATAKAARSASYALMSPGGQREAALAPAAQFIGRQAQVNCSELRAAFDSCTRSSLMGGGCEGLKRTWQGCIDEQKARISSPPSPPPSPCPWTDD